MKIDGPFQQSKFILGIFRASDRFKLIAVTFLQMILGVFDLIGVGIVGIISALSINGVQSRPPGDRVSRVIEIIGLTEFSFHTQIVYLGIAAATFFIGRTVISIMVTKKVLNFLALRGAATSSELILKLYSQELPKVSQLNIQETGYRITIGVNALMLGVVGSSISFFADSALLIVMLAGLMLVNTSVAIATLLFFASIGYALYFLLNKTAKNLGQQEYDLSVATFMKVNQLSRSFRELTVGNQRQNLISQASDLRFKASLTSSRLAFLPSVSKYIMEASLILGIMMISASQFLGQDNSRAVSTLAIFMAAGSRIAPAILRLQQGGLVIKHSRAVSNSVINLLNETKSVKNLDLNKTEFTKNHGDFNPSIRIMNLTYSFEDSTVELFQDLNLDIAPGTKVAIVGPSGSGKTTLVDLILGVRFLQGGRVLISGESPGDAVKIWPGAVAYVPQEVEIYSGTFRENIVLGYGLNEVSDEDIFSALDVAQLKNFALSLPDGLDSQMGERGMKLSGGQKQRIGIARAVLTNPKLIIFDEATSSLDGETESLVTEALMHLGETVTVIVIAHRLSSIMAMEQVIYLADSTIKAVGSFEEVRKAVPDFNRQAEMMGL